MPRARVFLIRGLTESFRSTYLPPDEIDPRPDSLGKAIPGAEVLELRLGGGIGNPTARRVMSGGNLASKDGVPQEQSASRARSELMF
jgi:hypothetical protein